MSNELTVGTSKALTELIASRRDELAKVLPSHITIDRLEKSVAMAALKNPELLLCTKRSLFTSVLDAAQLGLEPSGGTLGHGYLVPFNVKVSKKGEANRYEKQCQFIPGYRGLIDLARRAGDFVEFHAFVVYEKDAFKVWQGTNPRIEHEARLEDDRGRVTHFYAVAKTRDGVTQWACMTKGEVDKVRASSKSGANEFGPWGQHYEEMGKKTVVRRLIKLLPLSSERMQHFRQALELDDRDFQQTAAPSPKANASAVAELLAGPYDPADPLSQPIQAKIEAPEEDPIGDILGDDEPGGGAYDK